MDWGSVAAAGVSGVAGIAQSLFGPSVKKQIQWQKDAQKELNEQAAKTNYEYGELAAQNAYNRQMEMYQRSYQDQSYAAQKQQMKDAGLSVGLMYGQGASGGGAGSMTGAPQGETGGAVAGDAGAAISASIQMEQLRNQRIQTAANVAATYAQAKLADEQAKKTKKQTEEIDQSISIKRFEQMVNKAKEEWANDEAGYQLDNRYYETLNQKLEYFYNNWKKGGSTGQIWEKDLGDINFTDGEEAKKLKQEVLKIVADTEYTTNANGVIEFEKTLKKAQAYNQFMGIVAMIQRNEIEAAKAATEQYVAEWNTGQKWNWKTVLDSTIGVANAAANVTKAIK